MTEAMRTAIHAEIEAIEKHVKLVVAVLGDQDVAASFQQFRAAQRPGVLRRVRTRIADTIDVAWDDLSAAYFHVTGATGAAQRARGNAPRGR